MILTWMPARKLRDRESDVYPFMQVHWLVDEDGRVIASIREPREDNAEDSFDARLYWTNNDDTAYFISLEHAQLWAENRARGDREKKQESEAAAGVVVAVPQAKE